MLFNVFYILTFYMWNGFINIINSFTLMSPWWWYFIMETY